MSFEARAARPLPLDEEIRALVKRAGPIADHHALDLLIDPVNNYVSLGLNLRNDGERHLFATLISLLGLVDQVQAPARGART